MSAHATPVEAPERSSVVYDQLTLELLRRLGDASLDPIIASTDDGKIAYWNARAVQCFGWSEEEALGRPIHQLLIPDDLQERHLKAMGKIKGSAIPAPARLVTRSKRKDGPEIDVELSLIHIQIGPRRIPVCFARDLSEARVKDKALREAEKRLIHLSRRNAMGTMASALAHELSQPIAAARNYNSAALIELRSSHTASASLQSFITECSASLERASKTLSSIRGMVQRGKVTRAAESVTSMVSEVLGLLANKLSCEVEVKVNPDAEQVWADRIQIEQILLNLIRNASDAQRGSTRCAIRVTAARAGDEVSISVDDEGPGIPPERRPTLFSAFRSSKPDGMGMGLAICQVIAERGGGRLWLQDKAGPGACFCFSLPVPQVSGSAPS